MHVADMEDLVNTLSHPKLAPKSVDQIIAALSGLSLELWHL
jgi:hypothetical protein